MHDAAHHWVARHVPDHPVDVLEIGGRDVNGSVRALFDAASYTSVDLVPGAGVDVVADFTTYRGPAVDVVVCCEVAEHSPVWPELIANAADHLRPGGLFILTAAAPGRPPHSAGDGGPLADGEHYENVDPTRLEQVLRHWFIDVDVDVLGDDVRAIARKEA